MITHGMIHVLKTDPEAFEAMRKGRKPYEFRKDDRPHGFQLGDSIFLREYDRVTGTYTGREYSALVTYVTRGPEYGVPAGFAVLGLGKP